MRSYFYLITGQVQGVGFRPFVYRLAHQYQLRGWVQNQLGQVAIVVQGADVALKEFEYDLLHAAPPLAQPQLASQECIETEIFDTFSIRASDADAEAQIHVPPDFFTCNACLQELHNPNDRRYRYPFINCTQCGPRYTLINHLPYDRPHTSMATFPLCDACAAEYHDPLNRRFHAQPIACPVCGPQLQYHVGKQNENNTEAALAATVQALHDGRIIAVKGIGGYHLLCDAHNDDAIARLRERKPRLSKPLAVLLPLDDAYLTRQVYLNTKERQFLHQAQRPILLVPRQPNCQLSPLLAPCLQEVGVMLPYSPLHHLLLHDFGRAVVATSANVSGEPVLTANHDVEQRLTHVADAFLHHNRPIVRPADDAVYRPIAGQPRPLRLGRGVAPLALDLPFHLATPTLAVGGHLKNTVALAWQQRVVISPHIGDLHSPRSVDVFAQVIADLQHLYAVQAERVVCDAHPQYASHRWAQASDLPVHTVWHHHAHASALAGEFPIDTPWLIFTWDGVGLGVDNTLWGGETLYGQPGTWQRVGHWRPVAVAGGDKVGREPWRSAAALCWTLGIDWQALPADANLLHHAWQRGLNTQTTTAVGRLFDAAAALLDLCHYVDFEGQAPMWLEAQCEVHTNYLNLPQQWLNSGVLQIDWAPLVVALLDSTYSVAYRASLLHNSVAQAVLCHVQQLQLRYNFGAIGLSGGVFQNRYLSETIITLLTQQGYQVYLPQRLPCNDAGLSFGQIIEIGT